MGLTNLLNKPDEPNKYAIDKFWFILQNNSRWFLITPPTVVQREDYSDIEKKVTNYEKIMVDLDKAEMFAAIKKMRESQKQQQEQNKSYLRKNNMLNF